VVALTLLAMSRSHTSALSTFGAVAVASAAAAGLTVASYAVATGVFAGSIVQLPEYLHDYTHHGYTSPELYLSTHYAELLGLQIFSWGVTVIGLLAVTATTGLGLGRYWRKVRTA
jgi:hypothetical protein